MPDEVALNALSLLFVENSLLYPSHRFPALELYQYLVGVDGFHQAEVDMALNGIPCKVEGFVDLNECA
jgi:hypothetical protein